MQECLGPYQATPASEPKLLWRCRCDCGNTHDAVRGALVSGLTLSCGCLNRERAAERKTTHGGSKHPLYVTWRHMLERCLDPKCPSWKNYGGRGITICEQWRNDFTAFIRYIGPRPSDQYSVDRIDNDKGYEPGNVRWATREQQAQNRRRPARKSHCKRGHAFSAENTYWVFSLGGNAYQSCRACRLIAEKKRQAKNHRGDM